MRTLFILALVTVATLAADEDTCIKGLKRCKESNIYAIDRLFGSGSLSKIGEACELYASALTCLDTIDCPDTSLVSRTRISLRRDLDEEVEGGCLPSGAMSPCVNNMRACATDLAEANAYMELKSKLACAEVQIYDKCVEDAKSACSSDAIGEMMGEVFKLNSKGKQAGCDPDCLETLKACTYKFEFTEKDYCSSYAESKKCLAKAKDTVGCSSKTSQQYLDEAVKFRGSKYLDKCSNGAPVSMKTSALLILSALVATVVGKMFS